MKKLLPLLALLLTVPLARAGTCPSPWNSVDINGNTVAIASAPGASVGLGGGGITSCFYASKALGNDSNSGASESSPWQHIPGTLACSATCASHSPASGEGFVLRGGETWSGSEVGIAWNWLANSSHWNYIGVDQNWFAGGSWSRPHFDMSSAGQGYFILGNNSPGAGYWWIDNIEVTGMNNGMNGVYAQGETNFRASQLYFHAWTYNSGLGSNNVGFFSQGGAGSLADHNVVNGADSIISGPRGSCTQSQCATMNGFFSYWGTGAYNYISDTASDVLANMDDLHGNLVNGNFPSPDGDHCNLVFMFGPTSTNGTTAYGNVVQNSGCPGGINFWLNGNSASSSWVTWGFGNVIDASAISGNIFNIGNHPSSPGASTPNSGTYHIYNNTIIPEGGGSCFGNGETSPRSTTFYANNHCINASPICDGTGTTCTNQGTNINPSLAAANAQGYTAAEAQIFSPPNTCVPGTCSTLQAGTDLSSNCSGAITPLCSGIAYPIYNSGSNTMSAATAVPRPGGAWDIGAYQFPSGGGGLSFTVAQTGTGTCTLSGTPSGSYPSGTPVSVTASALAGSVFVSWTGTGSAPSSGSPTISFSLSSNSTATATCNSTTTNYSLFLTAAGTGSCTLSGSNSGTYPSGTPISTTVSPVSGSILASPVWSAGTGSAPATSSNPLAFNIGANSTATYTCNLAPPSTPGAPILNSNSSFLGGPYEPSSHLSRFDLPFSTDSGLRSSQPAGAISQPGSGGNLEPGRGRTP